ncbi:hypothetical protein FIBSPDRAFT_874229, partial [Athelia psychrophila]
APGIALDFRLGLATWPWEATRLHTEKPTRPSCSSPSPSPPRCPSSPRLPSPGIAPVHRPACCVSPFTRS